MKIAICDDKRQDVDALRDMLTRLVESSVIDCFETGEAFLAAAGERAYDLVFMDAAKGQYGVWLPHLLKCLKTGGVLFSDNVLQGGTIAESRFALDRRDRTIHARMREYLWTLTHTEGLVTSVVPCGDGAALTVKTRTEE